MPLDVLQITDTTIHLNKCKSRRAVIEDEDEEDEEVDQYHNTGNKEAGSNNEDDLDLLLEEGSSNKNWLITQKHALNVTMMEEDK
ncbi:hypothetical protein EV426DRAFT_712737 [Tirmania nivea]|nr:hypothetical protein EV426DRAFT_712737 [Tirmania nivea]